MGSQQRTEDRSPRQMRSDTRRNQRRMFEAVAQLADESPEHLTMQAVAARAEIGSATAYRYFSTIDGVLVAYAIGVVEQLRDFSLASPSEGRELFDAVLSRWIELLEKHGGAMVQLRSRRGFLERLRAGDELIRIAQEAWNRPVQGLLQSLGLDGYFMEHALFLSNLIFDPREIKDLRETSQLSRSEVAMRLTGAFSGALEGWVREEK